MRGKNVMVRFPPYSSFFVCAHAPTFACYVVNDKDISVKTKNYPSVKETLESVSRNTAFKNQR